MGRFAPIVSVEMFAASYRHTAKVQIITIYSLQLITRPDVRNTSTFYTEVRRDLDCELRIAHCEFKSSRLSEQSRYFYQCRLNLIRFNLSAFITTQKLERLIAAAPNIGLSSHPKIGIHTPAASGIPITLYINAQKRFS